MTNQSQKTKQPEEPMRLYKFKSFSNWTHVLDILLNNRLYCADWKELNDPMEGHFSWIYDPNMGPGFEDAKPIISEKEKLRICSLSSTYLSTLLWAHYAGGYSGVAFEIELDKATTNLTEVQYRPTTTKLVEIYNEDHADVARAVLSSKHNDWKYEYEYRILQPDTYFHLPNPPRRVIAGHRINKTHEKALRLLCDSLEIELTKTKITEMGISTIT